MTDLIKRLEEAEAGSRELDALIGLALDGYVIDGERYGLPRYCRTNGNGEYVCPGQNGDDLLPDYTTSIDTALALAERVLPGPRWVIVQQDVGWGVLPLLFDGTKWECPNEPGETLHRSLCCALCIAILKATDTGSEG